MNRPLLDRWPHLSPEGWCDLADLPTPVEPLPPELAGPDAWVKRDDLTSPVYGGNKVRTLEPLFREALRQGASNILATGATGSNHAVATILHAPRAGLKPGALLFPQPPSLAQRENHAISRRAPLSRPLLHWSTLPWAIWRTRRDRNTFVMVPGGATEMGTLGYVSAALELAEQVRNHTCPPPHRVVVGVGSTCTSAGLLLGLRLAQTHGAALPQVPELIAIRVSPWPVTSAFRIASLAARTSHYLARQLGAPSLAHDVHDLVQYLTVDGRFLGQGYGKPSPAGAAAKQTFSAARGLTLDTTYSEKSAAGFLRHAQEPGPSLYWATKSSAPLPDL